jgi:hypothetical protein
MAHVCVTKTIHPTTTGINAMTECDFDLTITRITQRDASVSGTWVQGKINNEYRFEALVFADHAESEAYELGRSKISKLWIQRLADRKTMFNFDRGLDEPAASPETQVMVDFLSEGLSDFVLGE